MSHSTYQIPTLKDFRTREAISGKINQLTNYQNVPNLMSDARWGEGANIEIWVQVEGSLLIPASPCRYVLHTSQHVAYNDFQQIQCIHFSGVKASLKTKISGRRALAKLSQLVQFFT